MFQLIKDSIFAFRFKRAVRKADRLHHVTHRKYMVLVINRKLEVLSKRELRKFVANGIFRKGTTVQDIEQKALYVTIYSFICVCLSQIKIIKWSSETRL